MTNEEMSSMIFRKKIRARMPRGFSDKECFAMRLC